MTQHRLRYPSHVYRLIKEHPEALQEAKLSHIKDDEAYKKQACSDTPKTQRTQKSVFTTATTGK